jgi:predicted thioredoxin/glutaredoxin
MKTYVIIRDQAASSKLDIESLVDEAVTPVLETDVETQSSVVLMNIDPLLTLDEAKLERDEKYMRQAIEMALSA